MGRLFFQGPSYRHADVLADYDRQRFNDIRALLAPGSTVEYVEDLPPEFGPDICYGYATQYVVCPAVVVLHGKPQSQVLLNGRADGEPAGLDQRRLVLKRDAGNGVRLYRAREP
jgi:hypothetical protein